jgi:hypothetical protein
MTDLDWPAEFVALLGELYGVEDGGEDDGE